MVSRALAGAFVVTVVGACQPKEPPPPRPLAGNPPLPIVSTPTPSPQPSPQPSTQPDVAFGPFSAPRDAEGRTIHAPWNEGGSCFVYLPFPPLKEGEMRVPGTAPPMQEVPCPAVMKHAAYAACRGGVIETKAAGCECFVPGNPPRVSPSDCPE